MAGLEMEGKNWESGAGGGDTRILAAAQLHAGRMQTLKADATTFTTPLQMS